MNTYIYKTKKYMIAQILWDLAGVICLAFSPLLQQWLFDYGLQSPLKKIVMANMFPYREMIYSVRAGLSGTGYQYHTLRKHDNCVWCRAVFRS